jgi:hypothetical protein
LGEKGRTEGEYSEGVEDIFWQTKSGVHRYDKKEGGERQRATDETNEERRGETRVQETRGERRVRARSEKKTIEEQRREH